MMLVSDLTHLLGDPRRNGVSFRVPAWSRAALSNKFHGIIIPLPSVSLLGRNVWSMVKILRRSTNE